MVFSAALSGEFSSRSVGTDLSDLTVGEIESEEIVAVREGAAARRVSEWMVASPPQRSGTFCHNPYQPLPNGDVQDTPLPMPPSPPSPPHAMQEPTTATTTIDCTQSDPFADTTALEQLIGLMMQCSGPMPVPVGQGTAAIPLPNGNLLCSLCDVGCADLKSLIDHTNGRAHQRRFRFYRKRSVIISGMPNLVGIANLQAFFAGLELDPAVQLCSETNRYQYVTFRSERDVSHAVMRNGSLLYGHPIIVAVAEPNWDCPICDLNFNSQWQFQQHHSSEKHQTRMVHCAQCAIALPNLPDWVKEADLMNLFRPQYPLKNKGTSHFLTRQYNPQSGLVQHDGYVIFASASIAHRAREAIETGQLLLAGAYAISAITVETLPAACLSLRSHS